MFNDHIYPPAKDYMSQPLYVRQPCSLQIIQLVECSPPPPPPQHKYSPSRLSSSSYSDSDVSDSDSDDDDDDSSAYDSSGSSLDAGAESYCSSAEEEESDPAAPPVPPSLDNRDPSVDDTYHTRQRRVSLWRDAVYSKNAPLIVTTTTTTASSNNSPNSNATSGSSPFSAPSPLGD